MRHSKKLVAVVRNRNYLSYKSLAFVLAFAVLGTSIIVLTHASTPVASTEAETGTKTGGATTVVDSSASGGRVVRFNAPTAPGGPYNPDAYCQFHVMGSLYGDASGNGPANGASWDNNNTAWTLTESSTAVTGRFARCAQYMIDNNIGGNGVATLTGSGNSYHLANFWPAGRNVPFPDDAMTQTVTNGSALEKRAFMMSVIEGEGEKCDPATTQCLTAQIADNYKTLGGGTNPTYYLHITALQPIAQAAGLTTAYNATGSGCTAQTVAQLQAGGGAGLCIKSSDFQIIKNWPVAACGRVPGYGQVAGYACGQPDAP